MVKTFRILLMLAGALVLVAGVYASSHRPPPLNTNVRPSVLQEASLPATPSPTPTRLPPRSNGSAIYLVPDSEVVYGPAYRHFDWNALGQDAFGPLATYHERVDDASLSGAQILKLTAERFSVGPRVLLTLLELREGWVSNRAGYQGDTHCCLYGEANEIASALNEGYYRKLAGTLSEIRFRDGRTQSLSGEFNAGTAAVYFVLAGENTQANWSRLTTGGGFAQAYATLFGDPFTFAVDPVVPPDLRQPVLRVPWEDGHLWFYTGGPHGAWLSTSGKAAVDFAPQGSSSACAPSSEWAIAAAGGRIVSSEHGRVMLNLNGDDFQGSGWTLMYLHIASFQRVPVGMLLNTGDRIGHPSCEGGVSTGSHLHLARLYNGQWISADDPRVPLTLSGWVVNSYPAEYEGSMIRGAEWRLASTGHSPQFNGMVGDAGVSDSSDH